MLVVVFVVVVFVVMVVDRFYRFIARVSRSCMQNNSFKKCD